MSTAKISFGSAEAPRAVLTMILMAALGLSATLLAWAGGDIHVAGSGWWMRTLFMLALPTFPFALFGSLAGRIYSTRPGGSVILVCLGANAILHFFGCQPLWVRTAGWNAAPGLIFDSVWIDLGYHFALIALAFGCSRLKWTDLDSSKWT